MMDTRKQIERVFFVLTSPVSFLRFLRAALSNRYHRLTAAFGPRRVRCNLCGWEGRRFDYFLERSLVVKDSQCPGCGSQTRNRELVGFMDKEMHVKGIRVLDIAPAPMYREWFEGKGADYFSIDPGERKAMADMDARDMSFSDSSFDLVICSHVLEHIPDYEKALSEIRRVLKEGGTAFIDVPFTDKDKSKMLEKPDHQGHWHEFGIDFADIIRKAGFDVETRVYSSLRDPSDPDNLFFVARKRP